DEKAKRDEIVNRLGKRLRNLAAAAKKAGLRPAPFIGIGCPGTIRPDGSIAKGGQNLPGNWESSRFNLPRDLKQALPAVPGRDTVIIMHNDAVVQGLSQMPWMKRYKRWGAVTIGTGLGTARFTRRD